MKMKKRTHLPPTAHPWGPAGVRQAVKYAVSLTIQTVVTYSSESVRDVHTAVSTCRLVVA